MTATQKRSFFASLVVRGLTLALLLCTWGVVASFVLMPTVGDATRRLTGFLRVETLIGLVILGVIASLPFTRLGHRTTRGRGMSTNKGSRKLWLAILFGAPIVAFWVVTTSAQLAAAESISVWRVTRRLHPAGYVLAVISALPGLYAVWPRKAQK